MGFLQLGFKTNVFIKLIRKSICQEAKFWIISIDLIQHLPQAVYFIHPRRAGTLLQFLFTVASFYTSRLEAHAGFFSLLMKGIFDPSVLWPFDKKLISQLRTWIRIQHYTTFEICFNLQIQKKNNYWDNYLGWIEKLSVNVVIPVSLEVTPLHINLQHHYGNFHKLEAGKIKFFFQKYSSNRIVKRDKRAEVLDIIYSWLGFPW